MSSSPQNANRIEEAARWLAKTPDDRKPHPLIPHLHKAYGLSTGQAVTAIREAKLIRARAT